MGSPTLPHPARYHHPHRKHRFRLPAPVPILFSIIAFILYLQFAVLPRFLSEPSLSELRLSQLQLARLNAGLQKCGEFNTPAVQYEFPVSSSRDNPRWNPVTGQSEAITLRNATLFDGEKFIGVVDIHFSKGVIISVSPTLPANSGPQNANVINLDGNYVTPGLVDMHSHHLVGPWPRLHANDDTNEMGFGPLTPFVRALDSIKPDDPATTIIASGGVTSSLILPGSANIMGGEGFMVKNFLRSGPKGEEVVEELLLEHGIPQVERRRYMKMACGENPRGVYKHTRMGNAWAFRKHMERAKEVREKQDAWCASAAVAKENGDAVAIAALVDEKGGLPEKLELESSVAMLRGKIGINVHCYEPEDFEDMLLHSKEFKFRIQAFHHALSAWKVPEMIKEKGENITIATFSTFGLYKKEAYEANLWAGKILSDHGIPVAYKSDHTNEQLSAKYLLFQAATAHSFHLPEDLALQSVTSVPAKSLGFDHRIGFVRQGYDADIVVWDSHPLSVGATPLQVYIDGRATLDEVKVVESSSRIIPERRRNQQKPMMRTKLAEDVKADLCHQVKAILGKTVITGITKSYLQSPSKGASIERNFTLVLEGSKVLCFDSPQNCLSSAEHGVVTNLENGHVLPGLTAVSGSLGLVEISSEDGTGDGRISQKGDLMNPEDLVYAKHGVHLEGRGFDRARIAGITRVISPPISAGFVGGVSVGIKTNGKQTILDGGIFQDDVALHFTLGQAAKGESPSTVSSSLEMFRKILVENKGKDSVYGKAVNGSIPVVVHIDNKVSRPRC
jgi:imidazolonepropionase-like amidohydrolase